MNIQPVIHKTICGIAEVTQTSVIYQDGHKEIHVFAVTNNPSATFDQQLSALLSALQDIEESEEVHPAFVRCFLSDIANQHDKVENLISGQSFPVSVIQQAPANGTKAALWAILLSDAETTPLSRNLFRIKSSGETLYWSSLCGKDGTSEEQTLEILNEYVRQLDSLDMTLAGNCQRTWFFVNDIDNHYPGMVKGRNEIFQNHGLTTDTHFIASTGIGGRSSDPHTLVTMEALALPDAASSDIRYLYAPHRLNRTSEYGVHFERGAVIKRKECSTVLISGTASIDNYGKIVCPDDVIGQAHRMMGNIEALLEEAGCTMKDVQSAIVYLRDFSDYHRVKDFFSRNYPDFPHITVLARVCRPGWLIETECIAISR